MSRCSFLLAFLFLTPPALAADHVWLEGEAPTRANVKFDSGGWGHQEYLSAGKWLFASIPAEQVAKKLPAEGAVLEYDFTLDSASRHEVWARVGYEFVRSPFRWRIDRGEYADVGPDVLTTDLMALQDWNEVAWLKLGHADLKAGKHTLTIDFPRPMKKGGKQPDRLLFGLDCLCLSRTPFVPNGPHPPGAKWQSPDDVKAARHVFTLAAPTKDERTVTRLGGLWQVARLDEQELVDRTGPVKALPGNHEKLPFKSIRVPGGRDDVRPDLTYCHRLLYRCRVQVPAEAKGRGHFLRFPSTALIASVLVNGRYCGFNRTPTAAWDCDVSAALRPGQVNEIGVVIKDLYYALAQTGDGRSARYAFNVPPGMFHNAGGLNLTRFADFPVLFDVRSSGILEEPSLVSTPGTVYAADVFARPSVSSKRLAVDVTLRNPAGKERKVRLECQVVPTGGKKVEKTFAPREVTVPAGGEKTVTLSETWEKPRLWWPDDPRQYLAVTTVVDGKRTLDRRRTKFGFREWGWKGKRFTLNGVPWSFRADLTYNDRPPADPVDAVRTWRRIGMNMFRYWGPRPWTGRSQEETLDFFDRHGVPVRRSGVFDGQVASYLLVEDARGKTVARKALFDHWIEQLRAWVKAERNHPSIFVWSIENEITYINARNFGWLDAVEPQIRRAAEAVMGLDPTRPAMIDGGDALRDRSLPIYGNHYNEADLREYPDEAYTMKIALDRHRSRAAPWPIGGDRPLFLGESFFASGFQPSAFAQLGGEAAFLGWPEARRGVERYAKMLSEGYRWWGVAAFHFWLGPDRADLHHHSWQPVCVLCREWNWTFSGGQKVKRTFKLFNDTRRDQAVTLHIQLAVPGHPGGSGEETIEMKAGVGVELEKVLALPAVQKRTPGELVLTCRVGGKEVFRDVKPLAILPAAGGPVPKLAKADLVVFDPKGCVQARLDRRKVAYTDISSLDDLPKKARVVVIGPDALTRRQATDPRWQALAAGGTRVLVLEQTNPLHYQAVPADLEVTQRTGRVAFSENLEHPAFVGLEQGDFFCWSGDHVVYRGAYRKPGRGARSLVQCDEGLSYSALLECPLRDGLLLLCQMPVGTKMAGDAVAGRLFDNLLAHAAAYKRVQKKTAIVFARGDPRAKMLESLGLKATPADDLVAALRDTANEVVVADAAGGQLKALAARPEVLKAFGDRGGYLMLWGLTPEGLAAFNRLVGFDHVIRPFRMERVALPAVRDPILAGLTLRDVVLESTKRIFPWSGDLYPADDAFTHVVDLDDIAPFCSCPGQPHGWSQMTNGLVSADAWVFIFSHNLKDDPKPRWTAKLPKEEVVTRFEIVPNTFYYHLRKLRLVFNGDDKDSVTLDLKPAMTRQDFAIDPPRKARTITLVPEAWDRAHPTTPVISMENLWIRVARPESYRKKVVPLLNIGALVKYRMGKGGIILNQVKVQASETNPVNAQKKRTIVATLLGNLGAVLGGGRTLVAGANLRYTPVPLGEKCNQYLGGDRGWLKGQPDLAHLPVGEQTFAQVRYQVRDFRTSPLPACIMLAGKDARGDLPKAVSGIPVGHRADVLFFLHTLHPARPWTPPRGGKGEPPVVVEYVVHYEDGKSQVVPVRLGVQIGPWLQFDPRGLPGAAVAWAARPDRGGAGRQAVLYQMPWTNPRPGVAIRSLDVRYNAKEGNTYGVPVLVAVTAARAE